MNSPFSHLRVSSEYSITHGLLTIDQIVDKAKEYSTPSVALTDNLNMFGLVKFFHTKGANEKSRCPSHKTITDKSRQTGGKGHMTE